jgi:hypothetical protein
MSHNIKNDIGTEHNDIRIQACQTSNGLTDGCRMGALASGDPPMSPVSSIVNIINI